MTGFFFTLSVKQVIKKKCKNVDKFNFQKKTHTKNDKKINWFDNITILVFFCIDFLGRFIINFLK